jgi:pimeloyl-ACP methyl ester carboxylesterase
MAPVAEELSSRFGVLEPLQTASSVAGQIAELVRSLTESADLPVTLIGHSWGAWLSMMTAADSPAIVSRLILVSGGPFEERYASEIMPTRLARLTTELRSAAERAMGILNAPAGKGKDSALRHLGELLARADAYDPIPEPTESRCDSSVPDSSVFENVWQEAAGMRKSGKLLELAKRVQCPVTAIHGDYDPHPAEGVRVPLTTVLRDFRFVLLRHCGHKPWLERQAREEFFRIIETELGHI